MMPDSLTTGLSTANFADLIAYLQSLRAAKMGTPGSGVTGPIALPPGFSSNRVATGITGATGAGGRARRPDLPLRADRDAPGGQGRDALAGAVPDRGGG